MKTEEILIIANIILTLVTLTIGYSTYRFSKKKDLEDKLFHTKMELYKEINLQCYYSYHNMNPRITPFKQLEDYKTENERKLYFENELAALKKVGYDIEDKLFEHSLFIPSNVTHLIKNHFVKINSYLLNYSMMDKNLNLKNHKELWNTYINLLEAMRKDLKIENIDKGLLNRIERKIL